MKALATMRQIVGEQVLLTPVNACERFVQRELPWLSAMPSPTDAPRHVLAGCATSTDALNVSLAMRKFSDAKFAALLGISKTYLSYLRHGHRTISKKSPLVNPICALTGTNLLRQWFDLQTAIDAASGMTERSRIEALANQLRAA